MRCCSVFYAVSNEARARNPGLLFWFLSYPVHPVVAAFRQAISELQTRSALEEEEVIVESQTQSAEETTSPTDELAGVWARLGVRRESVNTESQGSNVGLHTLADISPVTGLSVKRLKQSWADIDLNEDVEFQETIAEESDTQPAFVDNAYLDLTREAGEVIYQDSANREDNDLSMAKRKEPSSAEMEETIRVVATMAAEQAVKASDASWDKRVQDILVKQNLRTDGLIKESEKRTDEKFDALKTEFESLRKDVKQCVSSSGSTTATNSVAASPLTWRSSTSWSPNSSETSPARIAARHEVWRARHVELKGWVTNWNDMEARTRQSLEQAAMDALVDSIFANLTDAIKKTVDEKATRKVNQGRMLYTKVMINMNEDSTTEQAWDVRNHLKTNENKIEGVPEGARWAVEAAPWKQPHLVAVGKMMAQLRPLGGLENRVRPVTGPPESQLLATLGNRPQIMATFRMLEGWHFNERVLKEVFPDAKAEEILEKYRLDNS